ncbi:MAG: serine hydrolase, partial [Salibacteraceae bacterium]
MDHPVLKRIAKTAFWLLMIHFIIEVSGHHYLYNTIDQTVLKGRLGPGIQEFEFMPNNSMEIGEPEPWTKAANYNNAVLTSEESAHHESNESVSFIVIKKDHLLFEQYWQGFDKTSISNSFSMAKSIVSLLIGIAVDRGEINSIDDPVFLYLPQYETELGKKLKVRHLLNMSSGINFDEHYLNPFAFPARANYGDNLELLLEKYEVREEPGEVFIYQSGTTQVLGFLLKSATRQNLSDYASEHLWSKIGAENPALWSLDHEGGIEKAFCCIN